MKNCEKLVYSLNFSKMYDLRDFIMNFLKLIDFYLKKLRISQNSDFLKKVDLNNTSQRRYIW
jgi:hypothetical protein